MLRGPSDITITQQFLNTASYAGDPTPGALVSTSQVSGSIVQPYGGQLGRIITLAKDAANSRSDLVNGQQLYPGDYQYVRFDPAMNAAAAIQGQVVFWSNATKNLLPGGDFLVTADFAAPQQPIAGIALANTAKGNYWFIQIAGVAQVKFSTPISKSTPQVADLVYVDNTPTQYGDVFPDNHAMIAADVKVVLGRAWSVAPTPGAISPVILGVGGPQYVPGGGGGEG